MLAVTETALQSVLLPGLGFGAPEPMYVRCHNDLCRTDLKQRILILKEGGRASFDTFYNGLTVDVWRRHCSIDDLHLALIGVGTLVVRIGLHRIGHGHRWIDEQTVTLQEGKTRRVEISDWPSLAGGMLYFSVHALGAAEISGGYFATSTLPPRIVRLGLVITHYDRKHLLLPAVARLRAELLKDQRQRIDLVIVDNSRDVAPREVPGAILLPNRNLGGSGGFMRGLLHLKENGATHCLFMDDDASCETDSIRRALALLQYSRTSRFAVAGSLLRELEPNRLFEKGSRFNLFCQPQKQGLDMNHLPDLLAAEVEDRELDYGGWWFLAFAIADIRHYAFPYFVRGDDIQFCMQNRLEICTVNGVASWAEDFAFKSGPLPTYLDTRSQLLQEICRPTLRLRSVLRYVARAFFFSAFSYNYASAKAVTLAIADVAAGPGFWYAHLDMSVRRAQIRAFSGGESLRRIERARYDATPTDPRESRARRWLRLFTLNGFLLPAPLLKPAVAYQQKSFFGVLRGVFRHKSVLYDYQPHGVGYVAVHDKRRFFGELASFMWVCAALVWKLPALAKAYRQALPEMTSEAFWRDIYEEEEESLLLENAEPETS